MQVHDVTTLTKTASLTSMSSIDSDMLTFPNWASKKGSGFCDNLEPISR